MPAFRKAAELHNYNEEEVRRYVSLAVEIVEDEAVPDDLREAAFTATVGLLTAGQVQFEQIDATGVVLGPNGRV